MNVWLLSCLGVCLVGAWVPAGLTQGAFEDCCLAYHRPIPKLLLVRRATRVYYQPVSGSCNLQAVIFFMPRKAVCWNPRDPRLQEVLKILQNRGVQLKIPEKVLAALLSGTMKHHSGAPHVGNLVKTSSRNFSRPAMPSPTSLSRGGRDQVVVDQTTFHSEDGDLKNLHACNSQIFQQVALWTKH